MLQITRRRAAAFVMAIGLAGPAVGCFAIEAGTDIVVQPNMAGGYSASIRDTDGQTVVSCNYPADFGCQPGSPPYKVNYNPTGPNGENTYQGREQMWNDLNGGTTACTATDSNGQPGYGWPGYGGFTQPTSACVDYWQAQITDDPNDSATDEPMAWVCAAGRDCSPGRSGTPQGDMPGGSGNSVNPWFRAHFVGGNPSQGRTNTIDLILAVRDFYLVDITDPTIQPSTNPQRNGRPSCIAVTDAAQTDLSGSPHVSLRRACF